MRTWQTALKSLAQKKSEQANTVSEMAWFVWLIAAFLNTTI